MGQWWYVVGTQRMGPLDEEAIKSLLLSGAISADTLVWREGHDGWLPLKLSHDLEHLRKTLPPPVPPPPVVEERASTDTFPAALGLAPLVKDSRLPSGSSVTGELHIHATAWRRFFARIFDLWLTSFIIIILLVVTMIVKPALVMIMLGSSALVTLSTVLVFGLALVLDAIIYAICGNTPGKALLGVSVVSVDGQLLSFGRYMTRNMSVWVSGFAFGVPLVAFVPMCYQYRNVRVSKAASYDTGTYHVMQQRASLIKWLVFAVIFVVLLAAQGVVTAWSEVAIDQMTKGRMDRELQVKLPDISDRPQHDIQLAEAKPASEVAKEHGENRQLQQSVAHPRKLTASEPQTATDSAEYLDSPTLRARQIYSSARGVEVDTELTPSQRRLQGDVEPPTAASKGSSKSSGATADFTTCERPEYPRTSQRNEEEGVSTLSFLVSADGTVLQSKVVKSSGYAELDAAALRALSLCRFTPAKTNGKPVQQWTPVQYVWTLE